MNKWIVAGVIAAAAGGYLLWQYLTPVEIVAVHDGDVVLVKHFPHLKNRQIAWWEAHKDMMKEKYGIPHKLSDGDYRAYIQDFGDGYQIDRNREEDNDLLCFNDMKAEAACIHKSPLMTVGSSQDIGQFYW